jgi:hypothetical protein
MTMTMYPSAVTVLAARKCWPAGMAQQVGGSGSQQAMMTSRFPVTAGTALTRVEPSAQALRHQLPGRHDHRFNDAAPLGCQRQPDAPDEWEQRIIRHRRLDNQNAASRGLRVRRQPPGAGSYAWLQAYLV